ncbi:chromosome partitioning protein ParB [Rhizobium sp. 58]|nr:chromosome partitioning protein ParB [Rhizobium sp. 58]
MAEFKRIRIDQIHIPERLRAVEEDQALAIAQSIVEHGLINPITVRSTPAMNKGKTPYTLVAGAHRTRAEVLNDEVEIDAMVVEADQAEGQLVEITENLFRNDLSVIDRAIFVQTYREVWEGKYGKVKSGPAVRANLALIGSEEPHSGFSQHVADRMGLSKRTVKRLNQIALGITPTLRKALRGTPAADNQSILLQLVKLPRETHAGMAAALEYEPDIKKVMAFAKPSKIQTDPQDDILAKLKAQWATADAATQRRFLDHIGETQDLGFLGDAA